MFGLAVFITQNSISITQFSKSIDPAKIQVVWVSFHDLISITQKKKKKKKLSSSDENWEQLLVVLQL